MSEQSEPQVVNNSDRPFVTGVIFALMYAIETVLSDKIEQGEEKNPIISILNETLDFTGAKLFDALKMIRQHQRVPDLMAMHKEFVNHPKRKELMVERKKALDSAWGKINENK